MAQPITAEDLQKGALKFGLDDDNEVFIDSNLYLNVGGDLMWRITLDSPTQLTITPSMSSLDSGPSIVSIERQLPLAVESVEPAMPVASGTAFTINLNRQTTPKEMARLIQITDNNNQIWYGQVQQTGISVVYGGGIAGVVYFFDDFTTSNLSSTNNDRGVSAVEVNIAGQP